MKINKKTINIIGIFIAVFSSIITVKAATAYLYDADEVGYSNTGVTADNVQGAIDEIKVEADSYSTLKTKLNGLESLFPNYVNGSTTYKPFSGPGATLGVDSDSSGSRINYAIGSQNWGHVISDSTANGLRILSNNSSGTAGKGAIYLKGNPVQINGTDMTYLADYGTLVNGTQLNTTVPSTSVSSTTYTNIASIPLSVGTWLVTFGVYGDKSSSTHMGDVRFGTGSGTSGNLGYQSTVIQPLEADFHATIPVQVTTANTYYLKMKQTSGEVFTVISWELNAIRIK